MTVPDCHQILTEEGEKRLRRAYVAIVRNGFHASLMGDDEKKKALAEIDRVLAATP